MPHMSIVDYAELVIDQLCCLTSRPITATTNVVCCRLDKCLLVGWRGLAEH